MRNCEVLAVLCAVFAVASGKPRNLTKFQAKPKQFTITDYDCFDDLDLQSAPHIDCSKYWACDADGAFEVDCGPGEVFDTEYLFCGEPGDAICDWDVDNEIPGPDPDIDEECPLDTDEIIFLPSEYCDEYYICMNGRPVNFRCRPGQHWNKVENYCDDVSVAGCKDEDSTPTLPDCPLNTVGTFPHAGNCNWFWYCERGNRSLQQCQHLFHYDVNLNSCVILTQAKCIKDV